MLKRICLLLTLILILGIAFTGCGGSGDQEKPAVVLASDNFGDELYGIGFRPGDVNFINQVNAALNELIDDGTAAQISEEWFGEDIVYVPPVPTAPVASDDSSWEDIKAKGKFVMGLDDQFPPMGFRGESGQIEGFDIDLAKAVAEKLGVEVEFQSINWDTKEMELKTKNIDVVWNGLTMSQKRIDSGEWGFSQPYLQNTQVIAVMSGSEIDTIADLAGKKVGVQLESSAQTAVEGQPDILATFAGGDLVKFDSYTTALMDLKSGNVDAIVGDEILIMYLMTKDAEK